MKRKTNGRPVKNTSSMVLFPKRFDEIVNIIKEDVPITRPELVAMLVRDLSDADIQKLVRRQAQKKLRLAVQKLEQLEEAGGRHTTQWNQRQRIAAFSQLLL